MTEYRTLEDLAKLVMCMPENVNFPCSAFYFNLGANAEIKRLREAIAKDIPITTKWANEPFVIPRSTYGIMHDYLDGAERVRNWIGIMAANNGRVDMNIVLYTDTFKLSRYLKKQDEMEGERNCPSEGDVR